MENQYELKFERLITSMILSDNHPDLSQLDLFMDFHRNSCTYYDNFCNALYELSSGLNEHPLWITPSGNSYLSLLPQNQADRLILTSEQVPDFIDDLYEQLEAAIDIFQNLLHNSARSA